MRILKKKIANVQKQKEEELMKNSPPSEASSKSLEQNKEDMDFFKPCGTRSQNIAQRKRTLVIQNKEDLKNGEEHSLSNNIMKNYCRAIANFSISHTALKYLYPLLEQNQIKLETFKTFVKAKKSKINCIKQLRQMLLSSQSEGKQIIAIKKVFQEITIIFLKFFAPNWLFSTKISDKNAHLKYRFRLLRRVKDPIHFTYLQGFHAKTLG